MLWWWPRSLHTATVVAQDLALLTEVLRVLLALVRYIQAIRLLQGSLQREEGRSGGEGERTCSYRGSSANALVPPPFAHLHTYVSRRRR